MNLENYPAYWNDVQIKVETYHVICEQIYKKYPKIEIPELEHYISKDNRFVIFPEDKTIFTDYEFCFVPGNNVDNDIISVQLFEKINLPKPILIKLGSKIELTFDYGKPVIHKFNMGVKNCEWLFTTKHSKAMKNDFFALLMKIKAVRLQLYMFNSSVIQSWADEYNQSVLFI